MSAQRHRRSSKKHEAHRRRHSLTSSPSLPPSLPPSLSLSFSFSLLCLPSLYRAKHEARRKARSKPKHEAKQSTQHSTAHNRAHTRHALSPSLLCAVSDTKHSVHSTIHATAWSVGFFVFCFLFFCGGCSSVCELVCVSCTEHSVCVLFGPSPHILVGAWPSRISIAAPLPCGRNINRKLARCACSRQTRPLKMAGQTAALCQTVVVLALAQVWAQTCPNNVTTCEPGTFFELQPPVRTCGAYFTCSQCAYGQYAPEANATECLPWSSNASCSSTQGLKEGSTVSNTTCLSCNSGYFVAVDQDTSYDYCAACSYGFYTPVPGVDTDDSFKSCLEWTAPAGIEECSFAQGYQDGYENDGQDGPSRRDQFCFNCS